MFYAWQSVLNMDTKEGSQETNHIIQMWVWYRRITQWNIVYGYKQKDKFNKPPNEKIFIIWGIRWIDRIDQKIERERKISNDR